MKIACQTSKYNGLNLCEELSFALRNNFLFFDIFFDDFLPSDLTKKEKNMIQKAKEKGIRFSLHFPLIDYYDYKQIPHCLLDFVNELTPYSTTIHFNTISHDSLNFLINQIGKNTKISIENTIPDAHTYYGSSYFDFINSIQEKNAISLTFDIGHAVVNQHNLVDYALSIIKKGFKISTIHIHDNNGLEDLHQTLGDGVIVFDPFFQLLEEEKIQPLFIIEHWSHMLRSRDFIIKSLNRYNS